MTKPSPWDKLSAGTDCPLCQPRPEYSDYMYFVRKLSVSTLYLTREQSYRGTCNLVYDTCHVTRLDQLSIEEWLDLATDLWRAETGVFNTFQPDHINVESLGSQMPHLHWHIIPRYKDDSRWGGPIWMTGREEMPNTTLEETEYRELAEQIIAGMENIM